MTTKFVLVFVLLTLAFLLFSLSAEAKHKTTTTVIVHRKNRSHGRRRGRYTTTVKKTVVIKKRRGAKKSRVVIKKKKHVKKTRLQKKLQRVAQKHAKKQKRVAKVARKHRKVRLARKKRQQKLRRAQIRAARRAVRKARRAARLAKIRKLKAKARKARLAAKRAAKLRAIKDAKKLKAQKEQYERRIKQLSSTFNKSISKHKEIITNLSGKNKKLSKKLIDEKKLIEKQTASLNKASQWVQKLEARLATSQKHNEKVLRHALNNYTSWKQRVASLKKLLIEHKKEELALKKLLAKAESKDEESAKKLEQTQGKLKDMRQAYTAHLHELRRAKQAFINEKKKSNVKGLKAKLGVIQQAKKKMGWLHKFIKDTILNVEEQRRVEELLKKEGHPLRNGACLCPVVHSPVCGTNGITYSSSCVALCGGAKIAYRGACKCLAVPKPKPAPQPTPPPIDTRDEVATMAADTLTEAQLLAADTPQDVSAFAGFISSKDSQFVAANK